MFVKLIFAKGKLSGCSIRYIICILVYIISFGIDVYEMQKQTLYLVG